MIIESSVECRRFGLKAGRHESSLLDALALQAAVLEGGWDWLVLRLPCGQERSIEELRLLGMEPQQTDTLMTWSADLAERPRPFPEGLSIEPARASDSEAIGDLVKQAFQRYPNHYSANPLLDARHALEGYVEWALAHIAHPDRLCWVIRSDHGIAALSCSEHDASGNAVGVLHGVHPDHVGRGLYRGLIEASLAHYRAAGFQRFHISTQAGNHTVQNLWARLGLRIERSRCTIHLLPLLGRALARPRHALPRVGAPLEALHDFAERQADQPALRRSLAVAPGALLGSATGLGLRCLKWACPDGRARQVCLLTDGDDRGLAWHHSDLLDPARGGIR
jgi:GNAT superfamily N-acetyltransferase